MKIKRATIDEARQKALPILMAGYAKRDALRSSSEEQFRCPEKVARDKHSSNKPRISPI